ncbi:IS66 family insertion sequence element accessory protein TnpA [Tahibacter amnicola]|uniref:Transposase n=1 Tax=Tahibacter amnicola TaxID=2976241 RepID=A0ABY6BA53_9GAMM|nr:hypothetical protein [Tahibacter amnicola]MCU7370297.1 hypothetical protein [Paucibacter sp. O1-1]MDA3825282.1 hypothetical protein [Paucibacter sp. O1-1]UXI65855.1 hypothetical protein N4264_13910 [Tahibacter amnicola]UXI65971.1 hypothetical protein N4264_14525 [Tahibacter amnicola]UXI66027.1 hypothetical protein N4264_14840 [Tahibacter amnicola]
MASKAAGIRIRRSESQWREVLSRLERSDLSVAAFCEREGISAASVYRWRGLLVDSRLAPAASSRKSPFVDLGVVGASAASSPISGASLRTEIRLDLGGGLVIHVVRG